MEGIKAVPMLHQFLSVLVILSLISSNESFSLSGLLVRKSSSLSFRIAMTATEKPVLIKVGEKQSKTKENKTFQPALLNDHSYHM